MFIDEPPIDPPASTDPLEDWTPDEYGFLTPPEEATAEDIATLISDGHLYVVTVDGVTKYCPKPLDDTISLDEYTDKDFASLANFNHFSSKVINAILTQFDGSFDPDTDPNSKNYRFLFEPFKGTIQAKMIDISSTETDGSLKQYYFKSTADDANEPYNRMILKRIQQDMLIWGFSTPEQKKASEFLNKYFELFPATLTT
jgi:hypothetical protein